MGAEGGMLFDVRRDVARNKDPFVKIMRAVDGLAPGQPLTIISEFQPRLLYKALHERGFTYVAERKRGVGWAIEVHKPTGR